MISRAWVVVGAVIPAALWLAGCSSDPAAPQDASNAAAPPEISGPAFHVISNTCDFMTGGGFLGKPKSKTWTWGMHAGRSEDGTVFGHLNVVDHVNGITYKSTRVLSYGVAVAPFFVSVPAGGVTRVFEGRLRVNNGPIQNFTVYFNDSGEPGKNVDMLYFKVNGVSIIAGPPSGGLPTLVTNNGGNFQFHDHCIQGNPQSGK
jgi:hypothetical protein